MNCFYHPQVSAVGICKYCQKGLCTECAVDLGHGMGCIFLAIVFSFYGNRVTKQKNRK